MSQYTNPIPVGDDPSNYSDLDKVAFIKQLREDRRNKGIAIPRFVRALNKAGYSITVTTYKTECETYPQRGIAHVNEWILEYAYRVLNSVRVQNSVQGPHTAYAMEAIASERMRKGLDYYQMAEKLSKRGITITEAEYRTSEQGMTKHVSFEVITECANILDLDPRDVMP